MDNLIVVLYLYSILLIPDIIDALYIKVTDMFLLLIGCYCSDTKDLVPKFRTDCITIFCRSQRIDILNKH